MHVSFFLVGILLLSFAAVGILLMVWAWMSFGPFLLLLVPAIALAYYTGKGVLTLLLQGL